MVIMAAADEAELTHMVATAAAHNSGPIAFRYPRGEGVGVELPTRGVPLLCCSRRVFYNPHGLFRFCLGARRSIGFDYFTRLTGLLGSLPR